MIADKKKYPSDDKKKDKDKYASADKKCMNNIAIKNNKPFLLESRQLIFLPTSDELSSLSTSLLTLTSPSSTIESKNKSTNELNTSSKTEQDINITAYDDKNKNGERMFISGNIYWLMWHTSAQELNNYDHDFENFIEFLMLSPRDLVPCVHCRKSYRNFVKKPCFNVKTFIKSHSLPVYVYLIHNAVNNKLKRALVKSCIIDLYKHKRSNALCNLCDHRECDGLDLVNDLNEYDGSSQSKVNLSSEYERHQNVKYLENSDGLNVKSIRGKKDIYDYDNLKSERRDRKEIINEANELRLKDSDEMYLLHYNNNLPCYNDNDRIINAVDDCINADDDSIDDNIDDDDIDDDNIDDDNIDDDDIDDDNIDDDDIDDDSINAVDDKINRDNSKINILDYIDYDSEQYKICDLNNEYKICKQNNNNKVCNIDNEETNYETNFWSWLKIIAFNFPADIQLGDYWECKSPYKFKYKDGSMKSNELKTRFKTYIIFFDLLKNFIRRDSLLLKRWIAAYIKNTPTPYTFSSRVQLLLWLFKMKSECGYYNGSFISFLEDLHPLRST